MIKWLGVSLFALLLIAWVMSKWWMVVYGATVHGPADAHVLFAGGGIRVGWHPDIPPRRPAEGLMLREWTGGFSWWGEIWGKPWTNVTAWGFVEPFEIRIPFWPTLVVLGFVVATAWRFEASARRRVRIQACGKCGYDLSGSIKKIRCPECGETLAFGCENR